MKHKFHRDKKVIVSKTVHESQTLHIDGDGNVEEKLTKEGIEQLLTNPNYFVDEAPGSPEPDATKKTDDGPATQKAEPEKKEAAKSSKAEIKKRGKAAAKSTKK